MRKKLFPLWVLWLCALGSILPISAQTTKKASGNAPVDTYSDYRCVLFNFDWKFQMGNPRNAEQADYDDSEWRKLDLPHDYQFEQPWNQNGDRSRGFKPMCEGWYRKSFTLPDTLKGRRVVLDFEGVMYVSDVYVNGKKVVSNEYGYTGFEADITRALNWGGRNVVAVYSSTRSVNSCRWYTGGGIYRSVWLRVGNDTRIARHGLYVTT